MPTKARKPCNHTACYELSERGKAYCTLHRPNTDWVRTQRQRMYHSKFWRVARKMHIQENPMCVHCNRANITRAATDVDHITPHEGNYKLFTDPNNLQSLCKSCHGKKTIKERMGKMTMFK